MLYAGVIIDISHSAVDKVFYYELPENINAETGMLVKVPFGKGNTVRDGYIVEIADKVDIEADKLKSVISLSDNEPVISQRRLQLAVWMKKKYYTTLSSCIQCMLPVMVNKKKKYIISLNTENPDLWELIRGIRPAAKKQLAMIELLKSFFITEKQGRPSLLLWRQRNQVAPLP